MLGKLNINIKCVILSLIITLIYLACSIPLTVQKEKKNKYLVPIIGSLLTAVLAVILIIWYNKAYGCTKILSWSLIIFSTLAACVPLIAYGMYKASEKVKNKHWRLRQFVSTVQYLYMWVTLAIIFYVLMAWFDEVQNCEFKMRPTIASGLTYWAKPEHYIKNIDPDHVKKFVIYSVILWFSFTGFTVIFPLVINFKKEMEKKKELT